MKKKSAYIGLDILTLKSMKWSMNYVSMTMCIILKVECQSRYVMSPNECLLGLEFLLHHYHFHSISFLKEEKHSPSILK